MSVRQRRRQLRDRVEAALARAAKSMTTALRSYMYGIGSVGWTCMFLHAFGERIWISTTWTTDLINWCTSFVLLVRSLLEQWLEFGEDGSKYIKPNFHGLPTLFWSFGDMRDMTWMKASNKVQKHRPLHRTGVKEMKWSRFQPFPAMPRSDPNPPHPWFHFPCSSLPVSNQLSTQKSSVRIARVFWGQPINEKKVKTSRKSSKSTRANKSTRMVNSTAQGRKISRLETKQDIRKIRHVRK